MKLKNKVAVLTGASDGLGREIALCLAKEGVELHLIARNEKRLNEVALESGSNKVKTYICDLRDSDKIQETLDQIISDTKSKVDIVINCAGIYYKEGKSNEKEVFAVNFEAPVQITQQLLPVLKQSKEARIVNIVSRATLNPEPNYAKKPKSNSIYTQSKEKLMYYTEQLKEDLAETNIQVAGVYTGGINTNLHTKAGKDISPERRARWLDPAKLANDIVKMISADKWKDIIPKGFLPPLKTVPQNPAKKVRKISHLE